MENIIQEIEVEPYLKALECPKVAHLIRTFEPVRTPEQIQACDPTAILRVASLHYNNGDPVFPVFQQDVRTLFKSKGVPLKLKLGTQTLKLFTHQLKALKFLRQCDVQFTEDVFYARGLQGAIAVLKMGLGKTLIAMTYACMLTDPYPIQFPTLVVASKTVMTMWQIDGFEKFMRPNSVRVLYLHKNWMKQPAIDALTRDIILTYDFVVTTYDVVLTLSQKYPDTLQGVLEYGRPGVWGENPNTVKAIHNRSRMDADRPEWTGLKVLYGTPWKLVISDESQRYANPKTKIFKAMMGLYGHRKLCLTGTPFRNYNTDIWSQLRWMGYRGITHSQHWRPLYMKIHNLNQCILSIDYPDTDIQMPPKHYKSTEITFNAIEDQVYNFMLIKAQEALDQMLHRKLDFICVLALLLVCAKYALHHT